MSRPVAIAKGVAFAFPDVCDTPAPPSSPVPIPYPNIAQLDQADAVTDESDKELLVGSSGDYVLLFEAEVSSSTGDEAGSAGPTKGPCKITQASQSVVYGPDEKGLVRFLDPTEQNDGNAVGMVLSAFPTVLVGD
ncbi:MAG: DUF4150 domain-containing protein [Chloroflexi bacterium]|nr:DUF4150 domain-containing protein [Chloroflexota bacterium]